MWTFLCCVAPAVPTTPVSKYPQDPSLTATACSDPIYHCYLPLLSFRSYSEGQKVLRGSLWVVYVITSSTGGVYLQSDPVQCRTAG